MSPPPQSVITIAEGLADDSPARLIRYEVFELEQHLPEKFDETDETALHAVLYLDGKAVACARAFLEEAGGDGSGDGGHGGGGGGGESDDEGGCGSEGGRGEGGYADGHNGGESGHGESDCVCHNGGDTWHLGRFAVLKPYRRQGLGSLVLNALEEAAQARGAQGFVLDAQQHAEPFYRAHGYTSVTDVYEICGYPHVTMRKALDGPHTP